MFGNFAKIGRAAGTSPIWILLNVNIIYSLAKAQSCMPDFQPKFGALSVFSFSSFVKTKFGTLFVFLSVFKIPFRHFVCFGKIINCTAVQLMK
jgi:hypothetical protein